MMFFVSLFWFLTSVCGMLSLQNDIEDIVVQPFEQYELIPSLSTFVSSDEKYIHYSIETESSSFIHSEYFGVGNKTGEFVYPELINFNDFQVDGDYLFSCQLKPSSLVTFFLGVQSNFSEPYIVSNISLPGEFCFGLAVDFENNILFAISGFGISSFDISERNSDPFLLDFFHYNLSEKVERSPVMVHDRLYFCESKGIIYIFNVSNPKNISVISIFENPLVDDCNQVYPSPNHEMLYVVDEIHKLGFVNITDLRNITGITFFDPTEPYYGYEEEYYYEDLVQLHLSSKDPNILFISGISKYSGNGFDILNISDIFNVRSIFDSNVFVVSSFAIDENEEFVYFEDRNDDCLVAVNITDLSNIKSIEIKTDSAFIKPISRSYRMDGKYLYILESSRTTSRCLNLGMNGVMAFPVVYIFDVTRNTTHFENLCRQCVPLETYVTQMKVFHDSTRIPRQSFLYVVHDISGGRGSSSNYNEGYRGSIWIFNISKLQSIQNDFEVPRFDFDESIDLMSIFSFEVNEFCIYLEADDYFEYIYVGQTGKFSIFKNHIPTDNSSPSIQHAYIERIGKYSDIFGLNEVLMFLVFDSDLLYVFSSQYMGGPTDLTTFRLYIFNVTDRIHPSLVSWMIIQQVFDVSSNSPPFAGNLEKHGDYFFFFLSYENKLLTLDVGSDPENPTIVGETDLGCEECGICKDWYSYKVPIVSVVDDRFLFISKDVNIQVVSVEDRNHPYTIDCVILDLSTISWMVSTELGDAYISSRNEILSFDFSSNFSSPVRSLVMKITPYWYELIKPFVILGNTLIGCQIIYFNSNNKNNRIISWEIGQIKISGIPNNTTDCGSNYVTLKASTGSNLSSSSSSLQYNVYVECRRCFGVFKWNGDGVICSGHGICVENDLCVCEENYFGEVCNITTCFGQFNNISVDHSDNRSCGIHGKCISFDECQCSTNNGFYDTFCDLDLSLLEEKIRIANESQNIRMKQIVEKFERENLLLLNQILVINKSHHERISEDVKKVSLYILNQIDDLNVNQSIEVEQDIVIEIETAIQSLEESLNQIIDEEISRIEELILDLSDYVFSVCGKFESTDPRVCNGNGICLQKKRESKGKCYCSEGFRGEICEIEYSDNHLEETSKNTHFSSSFGNVTSLVLLICFVSVISLLFICCSCFCCLLCFFLASLPFLYIYDSRKTKYIETIVSIILKEKNSTTRTENCDESTSETTFYRQILERLRINCSSTTTTNECETRTGEKDERQGSSQFDEDTSLHSTMEGSEEYDTSDTDGHWVINAENVKE